MAFLWKDGIIMSYNVKDLVNVRRLDTMKVRVRPTNNLRTFEDKKYSDWVSHAQDVQDANWTLVVTMENLCNELKRIVK